MGKVKQIIAIICSILILIILAGVAYCGIAGTLNLPIPEIISNFEIFYQIFYYFDWYSFLCSLTLLIGAVFSALFLIKKNGLIVLFILEVIFVLIAILHGFGAF